MNSDVAVRKGEQEPRVALEPQGNLRDAEDAIYLSSGYGLEPDPWQAQLVRVWLRTTPDGKLAAKRCGLSVSRQNGKNATLEIVELFKLIEQGKKILHTAHEVKTARKAFLRLKGFFEAYPELTAVLKGGTVKTGIRSTNGQESIELANGGQVEFSARRRGTARGFTVDDLIIDEAQELTDEQWEALRGTVSAAPQKDPQIIMLGTPPGPRADGSVFTRLRDDALTGTPALSWHEWSPAKLPEQTATDEEMIEIAYETNPGLGYRLDIETVKGELHDMAWGGFLRERCGCWDTRTTDTALIDQADWEACQIAPSEAPDGTPTYAVKFSTDGKRVSLAIAIREANGITHVESLGQQVMPQGATQLIDWFTEYPWPPDAHIHVEGRAGDAEFVNALMVAGIPRQNLHLTPTADAIKAHAGIYRAIADRTLTHLGQPELNHQVKIAGKRDIGSYGGWGWQPLTPDGTVNDLDAVTIAFGAVQPNQAPSTGWKGSVLC